jgi:peptidoglycan/LPS O-acetylase OafA/YrhL
LYWKRLKVAQPLDQPMYNSRIGHMMTSANRQSQFPGRATPDLCTISRESPIKESAEHIPALDGIRGFAALSIFLFHYAGGTHHFMGRLRYVAEPINFGWAAVSLFFVLSGYLISGILWDSIGSRNWWRRFYWRRSLRIFPLYYLALLIAIGHTIGSHGYRSIFPGVLPYFIYLQDVPAVYPTLGKFPDAQSLSHFWSLAVEEQFYLIWPFVLAWLYPKADRARNVCLLVWLSSLAFRVAVFATGAGHLWAIGFLAARAGELSLGAYLALVVRDPILKERFFRGAPWIFGVSLFAIIGVTVGTGGTGGESTGMATIGIAINGILFASLIALSLRPGLVASVFEIGWLRWLGRISYGIYVYHILLGNAFDWIASRAFPSVGRELHFLVLLFVAAPGTLIVASLSYYFFELRFLRLRGHLSSMHSRLT